MFQTTNHFWKSRFEKNNQINQWYARKAGASIHSVGINMEEKGWTIWPLDAVVTFSSGVQVLEKHFN